MKAQTSVWKPCGGCLADEAHRIQAARTFDQQSPRSMLGKRDVLFNQSEKHSTLPNYDKERTYTRPRRSSERTSRPTPRTQQKMRERSLPRDKRRPRKEQPMSRGFESLPTTDSSQEQSNGIVCSHLVDRLDVAPSVACLDDLSWVESGGGVGEKGGQWEGEDSEVLSASWICGWGSSGRDEKLRGGTGVEEDRTGSCSGHGGLRG